MALQRGAEKKEEREYVSRPVQSLLFETYFLSEFEDENGKEEFTIFNETVFFFLIKTCALLVFRITRRKLFFSVFFFSFSSFFF